MAPPELNFFSKILAGNSKKDIVFILYKHDAPVEHNFSTINCFQTRGIRCCPLESQGFWYTNNTMLQRSKSSLM